MAEPVEVLVVGAGPTGLALAVELASHDTRFRIIDRAVDRVHESRALAIQPRTLELLARHGLAAPLVEAGNPTVHLHLHTRTRQVSLPLFDLDITDTAYPFLLFLSQADTERLLGDHITGRGVAIEWGAELVDLDPGEDWVTCRLRHTGSEETVRARYVVGCDGARSTVRQQAKIDFTGYRYPQRFLLADLEATTLDPDAAHTWLSEAGMLFFFPLRLPATFRLLAMRPPEIPDDVPVTLDLLQAITDTYTGGRVMLHDPVWLTEFRLQHRGATHYQTGRIFLAGDAAHVHSPAGAQGMNTGIGDAVNLGWKLALTSQGTTHPRLLDTYQPERAPVGRAVLRMSDRAFTIATTPNLALRWVRTHLAARLAPLVLRLPRLRAMAFRTLGQLAIGYRSSPLSHNSPSTPRRGLRAGDRLPDAPLSRNGRATTLHAATATPGFHLLLCGTTWPPRATRHLDTTWPGLITTHRLAPTAAPGILHDPDHAALHRLGVHPDTPAHILIRPDGHLAYRATGTDLTGLSAYLTEWLTSTEATPRQ